MLTLRDLRKDAGYTIAETAEKLNVSERTYSRYEEGTRRLSLESVLVLSDFFSVYTDVLAETIIVAQLNSCRSNQEDSRQKHQKDGSTS